MENEILDLERQVQEKQRQDLELFKAKQEEKAMAVEVKKDENEQLVDDMFKQAVVHQVTNDKNLNENMLSTAKTYVNTSMQTISTNVDTKYKEAVFTNNKDACESYGFNEKTTPTWAVRFMKFGYSVMLAVYLFIASFTVMPVLFLMKKIHVAVKHTWIAIILALLIYLGVTFTPLIVALVNR